MSILLPLDRIASRAVRQRLFSGNQEGSFGGIDLATPRLGDRFAVDVTTTQLRQDPATRHLIAALTEAATADARIGLPAFDLVRPSQAGASVVVDGAGQLGSSVRLRGLNRGTAILRGQYLTIAHGGLGYLYMAAPETQVIALDGTVTLPIWPMLRAQMIDGSPVFVDRPYIEGRLVGFDKGATFVRNRVEPISFSIEERA